MGEKSCLYSLKKRWKLFKWRDKIQISALLYISYLAEIKYYESMLKPLIVTFEDVDIFFYYGFFCFFCRYIHFFKIDGGHFVFLSFFI